MIIGGKRGHSATTANVQAIYPAQAEAGFGAQGPYIGTSRLGSAFCFDPWDLYNANHISNPNIFVLGKVGSAKSSLVKTLLWRSMIFRDRRALIVDPKGEYGPLVEAMGVKPVKLKPGGAVRLNPLHAPKSEDGEMMQKQMLQAATSAVLKRELTQIEAAALNAALQIVKSKSDAEPTIRQVAETLLRPTAAMAKAVNAPARSLTDGVRDASLALLSLCDGPLAGMFDGQTTGDGVDFDAPAVCLDLSALYDDAALGIFMGCAFGWAKAEIAARVEAGDKMKSYWVYEEAWRVIKRYGFAEMMQDSWKITRNYGISNILVSHRLSDLEAAGDQGTRVQGIISGLIEDTDTHVIYRQSPRATKALREYYEVTDTELDVIKSAPVGLGVWFVGQRRFIVQHQLSPVFEPDMVFTDSQMQDADEEEEDYGLQAA